MFDSIREDIRQQLKEGSNLTKLIIALVVGYLIIAIGAALFPNSGKTALLFINNLALPSDINAWLFHFWTTFTHNIVYSNAITFIFEMVMLYFFGNIVGDLIGDKHVLRLFAIASIGVTICYLLGSVIHPIGSSPYYGGALGVILAFGIAAVRIAPNYTVYMAIGSIKLVFLFSIYALLAAMWSISAGKSGLLHGYVGGLLSGIVYIYLLRNNSLFQQSSKPKAKMKVTYRAPAAPKVEEIMNIDAILDKIKRSGIQSLTKEEKNLLDSESKKR